MAAALMSACSPGRSACADAVRAALPLGSDDEPLSIREEPAETPGMTYFIIDYESADADGTLRRHQASCAYMPDLDMATLALPLGS